MKGFVFMRFFVLVVNTTKEDMLLRRILILFDTHSWMFYALSVLFI